MKYYILWLVVACLFIDLTSLLWLSINWWRQHSPESFIVWPIFDHDTHNYRIIKLSTIHQELVLLLVGLGRLASHLIVGRAAWKQPDGLTLARWELVIHLPIRAGFHLFVALLNNVHHLHILAMLLAWDGLAVTVVAGHQSPVRWYHLFLGLGFLLVTWLVVGSYWIQIAPPIMSSVVSSIALSRVISHTCFQFGLIRIIDAEAKWFQPRSALVGARICAGSEHANKVRVFRLLRGSSLLVDLAHAVAIVWLWIHFIR